VYRTVVSCEDYLWKKGKSMFHMLSKRYYLLSGNCMYYYTHKSDVRPKGEYVGCVCARGVLARVS
jgi:hypothetical protein